MNFHRRRLQFVCNVGVLIACRFVRFLSPSVTRGTGGNSGTAAVRSLEARVFNDTFIVNFNLQLHDVAAGWAPTMPLPVIVVVETTLRYAGSRSDRLLFRCKPL